MYPRLADELIEAVEINNMQVAQFPNICPETAQQHKQEIKASKPLMNNENVMSS
jgi:hypothetical protein